MHPSSRRNAHRTSWHPPSAQDATMFHLALAAQQQEAAIQAGLAALNAKIIQAQTLAHANGWTVDDALVRVWGGLTEDEVKLLQLKALREEQARREHQLRSLQGQGQGQGVGQQLQQNALEIERAQAQLRALRQPQPQPQPQQQPPPATASEQRLAAKHQIEVNLRARSGRQMIKAVQRAPSPPTSDAGSTASGGGGAGSPWGDPHGRHRSVPSPPCSDDPWADQKPSLGALRRHQSRASDSGSDVQQRHKPLQQQQQRPVPMVVRQPIGPPAAADELGDRNFATRMRLVGVV